MTARFNNICVDCRDAYALAGFWAQVFGCPPPTEDRSGDAEVILRPAGGPVLLFLVVPEDKSVKNRLHLDVKPTDLTRAQEVARLVEVGATQVADHTRPDGSGWVVLADPEGNEFCVLRGVAE